MNQHLPRPRLNDGPREDDVYELAPSEDRPPARRVAPKAAAVKPLAHESPGPRKDNPPDTIFPDKVLDLYLPLALIGAGTLIEVVAALFRSSRLGLAAELGALGLQMIVGTATMLLGVHLAARARQVELGPFWPTLLKLIAVAIAPAAAITLLSPALAVIPLGWVGGLVIQFVLYFALLGTLLKLDESDTWYCVCVIFLVNLAVYFTMLWYRS